MLVACADWRSRRQVIYRQTLDAIDNKQLRRPKSVRQHNLLESQRRSISAPVAHAAAPEARVGASRATNRFVVWPRKQPTHVSAPVLFSATAGGRQFRALDAGEKIMRDLNESLACRVATAAQRLRQQRQLVSRLPLADFVSRPERGRCGQDNQPLQLEAAARCESDLHTRLA